MELLLLMIMVVLEMQSKRSRTFPEELLQQLKTYRLPAMDFVTGKQQLPFLVELLHSPILRHLDQLQIYQLQITYALDYIQYQ